MMLTVVEVLEPSDILPALMLVSSELAHTDSIYIINVLGGKVLTGEVSRYLKRFSNLYDIVMSDHVMFHEERNVEKYRYHQGELWRKAGKGLRTSADSRQPTRPTASNQTHA